MASRARSTRCRTGRGWRSAYKDPLKTGNAVIASGFLSRPSARAVVFQAAHVPVATTRAFVLAHPELRRNVREGLKQVGRLRESLTRPAPIGVSLPRPGDAKSRRNGS